MGTFTEILKKAASLSPVSDAEYERVLNRRQRMNPRAGLECQRCANYEYTFVIRGGERYTRPCPCKQMRDNLTQIAQSGLKEQMERCTFASFQTPEPWQRAAKQLVIRFVEDKARGWLLLAGQSGCGKTHLGTAAAGEFLKAGKDTRYLRWAEESVILKALVQEDAAYRQRIGKLKTCTVLYIDDFLKTQYGKEPSAADVRLAYELLDYRYNNRELITILSTERYVGELIKIDPALGGRIYERSAGYRLEFTMSKEKNWRLRH